MQKIAKYCKTLQNIRRGQTPVAQTPVAIIRLRVAIICNYLQVFNMCKFLPFDETDLRLTTFWFDANSHRDEKLQHRDE